MGDRFKMIPDHKVVARTFILAEKLDYAHEMMNIPEVWARTKGAKVTVAVLDTGVPDHVDLDVHAGASMIPGYKADKNGHATHCGGIIAAIANNGMGVAGIAPEVKDIYCAVLDEGGSGSIDEIIAGIEWAVAQGADVISLSLGISGAPHQQDMEDACKAAVDAGVTIVAAAGNDYGAVNQPACYDCVIAVGAVDADMKRGAFSSHGPEIDFAAAGVDVYSTYLNNSYAELSGTSMACPMIAAVAALIIADNPVKLRPDEVVAKIKKIAFDVGPEGLDELYGHGIPIFGDHPDTPPEPEEPDDDDDAKKKAAPQLNCVYWKLAHSFSDVLHTQLQMNQPLDEALKAALGTLTSKVLSVHKMLQKKAEKVLKRT